MPLKLKLDTIDGLDPAVASLYTQGEDGKYHLDAEGLSDIQAALKQANKEAAERRKALEKYKDVDPERYAELMKAEEDRAAKKAQDEGDFNKLKDQLIAKHQSELEAANKQAASLRAALESHLVDAQATAAIAAAKGVPQLLIPHVKSRVKVVEEDGQFKVQVLDKNGSPMVVNGAGKAASIADLITEYKDDPVFGRAFEGSNASGGGAAQPGQVAAKVMSSEAFKTLNPKDAAAFMASGGQLKD